MRNLLITALVACGNSSGSSASSVAPPPPASSSECQQLVVSALQELGASHRGKHACH